MARCIATICILHLNTHTHTETRAHTHTNAHCRNATLGRKANVPDDAWASSAIDLTRRRETTTGTLTGWHQSRPRGFRLCPRPFVYLLFRSFRYRALFLSLSQTHTLLGTLLFPGFFTRMSIWNGFSSPNSLKHTVFRSVPQGMEFSSHPPNTHRNAHTHGRISGCSSPSRGATGERARAHTTAQTKRSCRSRSSGRTRLMCHPVRSGEKRRT